MAGVALSRRVGAFPRSRIITELAKVALASAVAAAVMVLVVNAISTGRGREVAQLLVGGAAGAIVFVAAAWALKVEELATLRRLLPGR